ncbi:MAG: hypothetical protein HFE78_07885 [Clostridiales bacterium]|nr:hypothetical protein [Clostridiales bacterium]
MSNRKERSLLKSRALFLSFISEREKPLKMIGGTGSFMTFINCLNILHHPLKPQ